MVSYFGGFVDRMSCGSRTEALRFVWGLDHPRSDIPDPVSPMFCIVFLF